MDQIEDNKDQQDLNEDARIDAILDGLIEKAKEDFYTYAKLMAPEVLPEAFRDGRHIEIICRKFQEIEFSVACPVMEPKRVQVFLPPGSMKSRLANLFCSWVLGRHPNWCFLAIASNEGLAIDNYGRPVRDLVDLPQYKAIFPDTILKKDVQGSGRWDTTKKGRFVAKGAGANIAGRRAHIAICDDVIGENTTKTERDGINRWYQKGLRTRLLPKGAEIIINTRWYVDDLSGFMLKVDGKSKRPWEVVSFPALLDQETRELLWQSTDPEEKYEIGTSYWPEFWPTDKLLEMKETMPPSEWNALYMQNPIAEEGNIIKRSHFKYWEEDTPPKCKYVVVSLDTAFSIKETADYSAYSVWGVFDNFQPSFDGTILKTACAILLGSGKGRWEFPDLCAKTQELFTRFHADFVLIEDKASGQSLIQEMRRRGLPIVPYTPDKDKLTRLHSCSPFFSAGRVFVPQGKQYAEELIDDVTAYPSVQHDDLVDTVSQAILWLRDSVYIDNDGYPAGESETERLWKKQSRATYWSSVAGHA